MVRCQPLAGVLLLGAVFAPRAAAEDSPTPSEIFERRIMPIFASENPSSCTQCHLAGVDLKDYILPSHEKTFLSLRDRGLIDLDAPDDSKILKLIRMAPEQPAEDSGAALIHEKVRRQELEAFAAWIKAATADPRLRAAPALSAEETAGPARPDEVIRHARVDRLLESFEKHIWSQRQRCLACHMPGQEANPKHHELNAKHAGRHGEDVMNWMKPEGAEATMRHLMASGLIDTERPDRSLLRTKPLEDGVTHGGGKKMKPGDAGDRGFRAWLEDYAAVVNDQYKTAEDLPPAKVVDAGGPDAGPAQHAAHAHETPGQGRAGARREAHRPGQSAGELPEEVHRLRGEIEQLRREVQSIRNNRPNAERDRTSDHPKRLQPTAQHESRKPAEHAAAAHGKTKEATEPPPEPHGTTTYETWPFDAAEARRRQKETAEALGLPVQMSVDLGGDVTLELMLIPAGEFMMGEKDSAGPRGQELHKVRLTRPYYLGKYEFTEEQWERAMGRKPPDVKGPKYPVDRMSWNLGQELVNRLNETFQGRREFRLPTEAEWEHACRAGTATPFYTGETLGEDQANFGQDPQRGKTVPVGRFPANPWGLHDLAGNVRE
ncbi:MAG: formylglycine-generating enzyme family protein [Planctomycetales bacterium]